MTVKDRLHQLIDELPERELTSSSVAPALWEQFLSALALESERVGSERTLLAAELGLSFLRDERFARELASALARRDLLHRDLDLRNALVHQHFRAFFAALGSAPRLAPDPAATPQEQELAALLSELHEGWDERVQQLLGLEGGPLSAADVATRLGESLSGVRRRRERGQLLALERDDEAETYPSWQFTDRGLLPGVEEVLAALRVSAPAQAVWFLSGDARLGGRRPLDVLRAGRTGDVIAAAEAYGEQSAA